MLPTSGSTATRSTVVIHGTGRAPQGVRRYKLPQALSPIAGDRPAGDEREGEREDSAVELQIRGVDGDSDAAEGGGDRRGQLDVRLRAKKQARGIPESQSCTKFRPDESTPRMNVSVGATASPSDESSLCRMSSKLTKKGDVGNCLMPVLPVMFNAQP